MPFPIFSLDSKIPLRMSQNAQGHMDGSFLNGDLTNKPSLHILHAFYYQEFLKDCNRFVEYFFESFPIDYP